MKSAQTGFTERMLTEAIWLPDQFFENSLYLFPTGGTIGDLVQERIDQPINNNEYLASISRRSRKGDLKKADKVGLKKLSKGFAYFRSATTPAQITSVPADIIFVDEYDRMPMENTPYFKKRMEHSTRRWSRWASTPTVPNFGIHAKFLESDQHYCWVKCTHCNEWQKLTFEDNIDINNKCLVCCKCRKLLLPWECDMVWKPEADSDVRGYFINQLYSPMLNVIDLIKDSEKISEWEIQQFYNQNLGLPYEPKGAKLSDSDIRGTIRDYLMPLKEDEAFLGCDVGRLLHVTIISQTKLLFVGDCKNFEELDSLMEEYNVKSGVVDALPETREAQKFADRFMGRIFLCYYTGMKEVKEGKWFKTDDCKVNTNRTLSLDISTAEIKKQRLNFPKNIYNNTEFIKHLKNLTRVKKQSLDGNEVAEYVKLGDDHYRHALNYAVLGKHIFNAVPEPEIFIL